MPHLILQLALLIAAVFVIGCLFGAFARKRKANSEHVVPEPEQQVEAVKLTSEKQEHKVQIPVPAVPEVKTDDENAKALETKPTVEPVKVEEIIAQDSTATKTEVSSGVIEELISEQAPVEEVRIPEPVIVEEPEPVVEVGLPQLLEAARDDKPDDLLKIKGIGPTLQSKLQALGIYHYEQLAAWDADNAIWIGKKLNFPGRVEREEWVEQAAALSKLGEKTLVKSTKKATSKKTSASKPRTKAATVKASVKKAAVKTAKPKAKSASQKAD
ncbi:hypothetical protein ACI0FM_04555 [Paenochrobactrum sp. BZR 588]|uniref:hypothetical protein n=1 Tax=unclassified Paenochrobactrum TaxID=2639760 RepID=UPI0038554B57